MNLKQKQNDAISAENRKRYDAICNALVEIKKTETSIEELLESLALKCIRTRR